MLLSRSLFAFAITRLTHAAINFTHWAPPGPGDVRGPCPAMNSMVNSISLRNKIRLLIHTFTQANHHIIPHNGKNLTVALLTTALAETFNLSPEMGTIVSTIGLSTAPDPTVGHFQLNHLNKHNAFEHDASLSRVDFYHSGEEGIAKFDNTTFNRWCDFQTLT